MTIADGCEWEPSEDRAAFEGDPHTACVPAEVVLGKGIWRLCLACAALPRFKRYQLRREIKPAKAGDP